MCVKQLSMSPSEAWKLDYVEIMYLLEQNDKEEIDCSVMLNYERKQAGASKEWLLSHSHS